jgi:polygalacturonase
MVMVFRKSKVVLSILLAIYMVFALVAPAFAGIPSPNIEFPQRGVNVRWYLASGSAQSTTGSIGVGSRQLTLAAAIDFQNGQGINITGAGSSGGALITTIIAGGGTTALTLAATASTSVSGGTVRHDDTAAINTAISVVSNSGNGFVYLPAGLYRTSSTVTLPYGVSLRGENSASTTIKITANVTDVSFTGGTDEINGLTLDGGSVSGSSSSYGILVTTPNVYIHDLIIQNFTSNEGVGVRVINTNNVRVSNCIITKIGNSTMPNYGGYGQGVYIGVNAYNITVDHNTISYTYGTGAVGVFAPTSDVTIEDNNISNTRYQGIEGYELMGSGNENVNCRILNNILNHISNQSPSDTNAINGILCMADIQDYYLNSNNVYYIIDGNQINYVDGNGIEAWVGSIIEDNFVENTGQLNSSSYVSTEGIFTSLYSTVIGNHLLNIAGSGVKVVASSNTGGGGASPATTKGYVTINNNNIINCGLNTSGAAGTAGIEILGQGSGYSVSNVEVEENTIYDNQVTPTTLIGIQANIASSGTISNIDIQNNQIGSTIATPYALSSGVGASHGQTNSVIWGTAAPTAGSWYQGDREYNSAPAEAGTAGSKYVIFGWICTVGGTPGTWLQMRSLTGN